MKEKRTGQSHHPIGAPVGWWVSTALFALTATVLMGSPSVTKADKNVPSRLEAYFAFEFYPRFRYQECVVGMDFSDMGRLNKNLTVIAVSEFRQFLLKTEPKAAVFNFHGHQMGRKYRYEYEFLDACDRAVGLLSAYLSSIRREYSDLVVEIVPFQELALEEPVTGIFWTDSLDYDPKYWELRARAVSSCAAEDWRSVADYHEHQNQSQDLLPANAYQILARRLEKVGERIAVKDEKENSRWAKRLVETFLREGPCAKNQK